MHPKSILAGLLVMGAALSAPAQTGRGKAASAATPTTAAQKREILRNAAHPLWSAKAPATVTAEIETSRGTITVELLREWAPNGVDRFYNLARAGYYDDSRFYRVIFGFVAQFGLAADPVIANFWGSRRIRADSVRGSNVRGTISFAQFKPTDRTTNVFINLQDNINLDTLGFAPIGRVVQGMEVADSLNSQYGELPMSDPPLGDAKRLYSESNKYLDVKYPKLDRILKITIRP